MKVILAADHRGFELKEKLKTYLTHEGYDVHDAGAPSLDPSDDFPDFAYPAALMVAERTEEYRGIFMCGSGMGMDILANKIKGIRATVAYSTDAVVHGRAHDDVNVITLPADFMEEDEAKRIAKLFLETSRSDDERHVRRRAKITAIEAKHLI